MHTDFGKHATARGSSAVVDSAGIQYAEAWATCRVLTASLQQVVRLIVMQSLVDMLQYLCNVLKHQVLLLQMVNLQHAPCKTFSCKKSARPPSSLATCWFCSLVLMWYCGKLQGI